MSTFISDPISDGITEINGKPYIGNGKGGFQPVEAIKPQHQIEDETVRKIMGHAMALSGQMARFKEHTFADIASHSELLAQEYGTTLGGEKGNKTLQTVDGLFKVQVQVSEILTFGPELEQAKALFDECLMEWAAESRACSAVRMVSREVDIGSPSDQRRRTAIDIELRSLNQFIHEPLGADIVDLNVPVRMARFGDKTLVFGGIIGCQDQTHVVAPCKAITTLVYSRCH